LTGERIADLIEHRDQVFDALVAALRADSTAPAPEPNPNPVTAESPPVEPMVWHELDPINGFEAMWPEGPEHYGPMRRFEGHDGDQTLQLAFGEPAERRVLYGAERGWVSVWTVVNSKPRQQLANFIEADDFHASGERVALVSGKNGSRKGGYAPTERHLLPDVYDHMRLAVQRDRIAGDMARNRLAVVAGDSDVQTMLDHGLAHLRLRNPV
jgi:hypothetical protein